MGAPHSVERSAINATSSIHMWRRYCAVLCCAERHPAGRQKGSFQQIESHVANLKSSVVLPARAVQTAILQADTKAKVAEATDKMVAALKVGSTAAVHQCIWMASSMQRQRTRW